MAAGGVNVAQARAIVASLDRLPRTGEYAVSLEQRTAAETHLVGSRRTMTRRSALLGGNCCR